VAERWPERIDVGETVRDHNEEEHRARYLWAAERVTGRVLDVACGTGHGSELLAARCEVVGLDRDAATVATARARVPHGDFRVATIPPMPFDDGRFDAAISFETIEHIPDDHAFVAELRRVVRGGGFVLLSTPNRAVTSPNQIPPTNPYHVREYLLPEFVNLMHDGGFPDVEVWHQRRERRWVVEHVAAAVMARIPRLCVQGRWWDRLGHGTGDVELWEPNVQRPSMWVLACR
jgi:SAM-dependent methyltransferase